jgi:hypothetical protein
MMMASGCHDRLAQADLLVGDAAEGHHRGAGALGTETGEGLRVMPSSKAAIDSISAAGDDALAAPAVNTNLEHDSPLVFACPVTLPRAWPDGNWGNPQVAANRPAITPAGPVESRF